MEKVDGKMPMGDRDGRGDSGETDLTGLLLKEDKNDQASLRYRRG